MFVSKINKELPEKKVRDQCKVFSNPEEQPLMISIPAFIVM